MPLSRWLSGKTRASRHTSREDMDASLKAIVVPHLRAMGFKGSLPHFYRARGDAVDVLTFQFRTGGGSFVVELGRVGADGFDFHCKHIPPAKAKTSYLKARYRLGVPLPLGVERDHWFTFHDRDPQEVAREVCTELDRAEVWAHVDGLEVRG